MSHEWWPLLCYLKRAPALVLERSVQLVAPLAEHEEAASLVQLAHHAALVVLFFFRALRTVRAAALRARGVAHVEARALVHLDACHRVLVEAELDRQLPPGLHCAARV